MTASQALRAFTRGRNIRTPDGYGKVDGTSLVMETARMGRHRKLVLLVRVIGTDNKSRIYRHYDLPLAKEK